MSWSYIEYQITSVVTGWLIKTFYLLKPVPEPSLW